MPGIANVSGYTLPSSWLIVVNEKWATITRHFEMMEKAPDSFYTTAQAMHDVSDYRHLPYYSEYLRGYDAFLTLNHETVHFWHAISTPFMYYYSMDYIKLCLDVLSFAAHDHVTHRAISEEFTPRFRLLDAQLHLSDLIQQVNVLDERMKAGQHRWERHEGLDPDPSPISTLQVIEGCAVLCSYRLCDISPSHEKFLHHLDVRFSTDAIYLPTYTDLIYTGAYRIATKMLGELAFDLFAPACYMALHGDNPGRDLYTILQNAKEPIKTVSHDSITADPLRILIQATGADEERLFPIATRATLHLQPWHPVLKPYIEKIAQTRDLRTSDFFARPYRYFYTHGKHLEFSLDMRPPVHLFLQDGGRLSHTGLGSRAADDYIFEVIQLTAVTGVAERLIGEGGKMLCKHSRCPVYRTKLCQRYVAFPLNDYKECQFREKILHWLELDKFYHVLGGV